MYGHVAASSDHLYMVTDLDVKSIVKAVSINEALIDALGNTFDDHKSQNSGVIDPGPTYQLDYFKSKTEMYSQRMQSTLDLLLANGQTDSGLSIYRKQIKSYLAAKLTNLKTQASAGLDVENLIKSVSLTQAEIKKTQQWFDPYGGDYW